MHLRFVVVANVSKRERAAERRAVVEKMKREQKARERRRALIGGAVVVVILLAIVAGVAVSLMRGSSSSDAINTSKQVVPTTPTGSTTTQVKPSTMKNPTDIKGVVAYNTGGYPAGSGTPGPDALAHDHVTGPVKYAVTPPVGGPHNPVWMNAGLYTKPIPPERAVHNLEHGVVWITYRPDLSGSDVTALQSLFEKQSMISEPQDGGRSNRFVDLSPWTDNSLPAPIVISSWGYQLQVQSPDDPRLQQFIDTFRHSQKYTPEYGSAVDGIPVGTGGNPALGSSQPNL